MDNEHKAFALKMVGMLDERSRRMFLGGLSCLPGISIMELNAYTKISRNTISKGRDEYLSLPEDGSSGKLNDEPVGIRKAGAGRKNTVSADPQKKAALHAIMSDYPHDESTPTILHGTTLSLREIQSALSERGISMSHISIGKLLNLLGAGDRSAELQARVGIDLDLYRRQYGYINDTVYDFLNHYLPVLYIELSGTVNNKSLPFNLEDMIAWSIIKWWKRVKDNDFEGSPSLMVVLDFNKPSELRTINWNGVAKAIFSKCALNSLISILPPGRSKWNCMTSRISEYSISDKLNDEYFGITISLLAAHHDNELKPQAILSKRMNSLRHRVDNQRPENWNISCFRG